MDAAISVEPSCLQFDVSPDRKFAHASITLQSDWKTLVAFKIRVSVRNLFVVSCGEGFLEPSISRVIPVKLRNGEVLSQETIPVAKFALEFAEVSSEDSTDSPKAFWSNASKNSILRRTVYCTVNVPHLQTSATSQPAAPATTPKTLSRALTTMMSIEEISETLDSIPSTSSATENAPRLPQGRVLELMIKNVTKETPLSSEEIEELKGERAKLTKEQWNEWLSYARKEKQSRAARDDDAAASHGSSEAARRKSLAVIQSSLQSVWEKLDQKEQNISNSVTPTIVPTSTIDSATSPITATNMIPFATERSAASELLTTRQIDISDDDIIAPRAGVALPSLSSITNNDASSSATAPNPSVSRTSNTITPPKSSSAQPAATDLARSSVLRIDSAYSAAQCLLASLQAEQHKDSASSLAIISALMTSLEKSKESLNELTMLPSAPAPAATFSSTQAAHTSTKTSAVPSTPTSTYRPSATPMTKSQLDVDRYDSNDFFGGDFTTSRDDFFPLTTLPITTSSSIAGSTHPATAALIARSRHNVQAAKGHPRVYRLCVSSGVLAKTFEESPLRVDIENAAVDVVWRESRSNSSNKPAVLRRERFCFDDIYAGASATSKLQHLLRKRTRQAMLTSRGIGVVIVAAGHSQTELEPPVVAALGDRGGTGVLSAIVDEIFKSRTSTPPRASTPHRYYNYPHTTTVSNTEPVSESITFSAALLSDGIIIDLLGSRHSKNNCRVSRKSDGSYTIANLTKVLLKSSSDYERVAGVLLGRRSAMKELLSVGMSSFDVIDVPWIAVNHAENCIMFTITAPSMCMSKSQDIHFHVICPCGDSWAVPGTEVCLVAEALACLPHAAPHSLLSAGITPRIMVDPHAPDLDYITIAAINLTRDVNKQQEQSMIHSALHSLRTISQVGGQQ